MRKIFTLFFVFALSGASMAQPFVRFVFDGDNDAKLGTATFALTSGLTSTYNSSYPSATGGQAINTTSYPDQGTGSGTAGIVISASTVGKTGIVIGWNNRHSNSASRFLQLQYSIDGTNFVAADLTPENTSFRLLVGGAGIATPGTVDYVNNVFVTNIGDTWWRRSVDLSAVTAINNNANFKFRIVTVFEPGTSAYKAASAEGNPNSSPVVPVTAYVSTGTLRYDSVLIGANSTLPLTLKNIQTQRTLSGVKINWTTSNEFDVAGFDIEKSQNGQQFNKIGFVAAGNQSNGAYNFSDVQPTKGNNWYRLKMIDKNGFSQYSKIVKASFTATSLLVDQIFPTVATDKLFVTISSDKVQVVEWMIVGQSGQVLARQKQTTSVGTQRLPIQVQQFAAGTYRLQVIANSEVVASQPFIKQ